MYMRVVGKIKAHNYKKKNWRIVCLSWTEWVEKHTYTDKSLKGGEE